MELRPTLYGPDNRPLYPTAAPVDPIAAIGQVYDPFANRALISEVTPESLARMMRGSASLAQQQQLCKRILDNDAHFAGSYRNLTMAASGLDWEILARDKKSRKEQRIAEKVRDFVQQQFENLAIEELVQHLADGEYSPFAFAENQWDLRTKELRGWDMVDGARQYWDPTTSTLKVLTQKAPSMGEDLAPNMWVIHTSRLHPGGFREGGLWKPVAWWYCFKHFAIGDWLEFAAVYGKPWRLAFIKDPKDRDSVIKALRSLGVNAAGAFPDGTEVRLESGNTTGAIEVFHKLGEQANDEVSIVFTGHNLIQQSKSGSGTLAGKGAQRVHEKIVRKVSRGIMRTIWRYVVLPMVTFKFGYETAIQYTSPDATFKLKYEPPLDIQARATALGAVSTQLLRPLGKAISEQQIQEEFDIAELVDIKVDANAGGSGGGDPSQSSGAGGPADQAENDELPATRRRSGRELAAAAKATPLQTHEDVEQLGAAIGQRGFAAIGGAIEQRLNTEVKLKDLAAELWEGYADLPTKRLASLTRDTLVTAAVIGKGDANADS